jgi:hypothetical protein
VFDAVSPGLSFSVHGAGNGLSVVFLWRLHVREAMEMKPLDAVLSIGHTFPAGLCTLPQLLLQVLGPSIPNHMTFYAQSSAIHNMQSTC